MNNRGAIFFPPRAILNMAMLLPKSPVAREIRNQLLNITEATAPADRIVAIEDEEKMISDVARAYCSSDLTALANASSVYAGYLNRHLAAAREQITGSVRRRPRSAKPTPRSARRRPPSQK